MEMYVGEPVSIAGSKDGVGLCAELACSLVE